MYSKCKETCRLYSGLGSGSAGHVLYYICMYILNVFIDFFFGHLVSSYSESKLVWDKWKK